MEEKKISEKEMEELENHLESCQPSPEEFLLRRIHHHNVSKTILWMTIKSKRGDDFVYAKELMSFLKGTYPSVYNLLEVFVTGGLLEKKHSGALVEWWFVKNGNNPVVWKYLDRAKKVLGLD